MAITKTESFFFDCSRKAQANHDLLIEILRQARTWQAQQEFSFSDEDSTGLALDPAEFLSTCTYYQVHLEAEEVRCQSHKFTGPGYCHYRFCAPEFSYVLGYSLENTLTGQVLFKNTGWLWQIHFLEAGEWLELQELNDFYGNGNWSGNEDGDSLPSRSS